MWTRRRLPLYLVAVTLVVHGCLLIAVRRSTGRLDAFAFNSLDSREYYELAGNLVDHGRFSQSPEPPWKPDTWRTPGYPFFLAAIRLVGGASPVAAIAVQQLLCAGNVLLLFRVARRLVGDKRAALVAGLFLLEPYHLYYSLWLMATTVFVTVVLLMWHAWQTALRGRRWPWYGWLGALCGAAILTRPVAVLLPVLLGAAILVAAARRLPGDKPRPMRAWAFSLLALVLGTAVVILPWMARNRIAAGHFALSHQGGIVLAYFKAAEVVLWREGRTADRYLETSLDPRRANDRHRVWEEIDARLHRRMPDLDPESRTALHWRNLAQGNKTPIDPFELSAELTRIGADILAANPFSTAACCLTRCGSILTFPLNLALQPPREVQVDRYKSVTLSTPYILLSIAVVVALIRRRATFTTAYFPLACTMGLLLATTPQVDPRFRVPMIPMLLLVALLPRPDRRPSGLAEE